MLAGGLSEEAPRRGFDKRLSVHLLMLTGYRQADGNSRPQLSSESVGRCFYSVHNVSLRFHHIGVAFTLRRLDLYALSYPLT